MKQYVISGIGTEVGKTVVSAIVSEALQATYWKPVQAGELNDTDSHKVERLTSNVRVLPELFQLNEPLSPHAAAEIDGVELNISSFILPNVATNLVIEGAGGILVPINKNGLLYADVFQKWNLPVIIVSRHYLGSINHSLLTAEVLKNRGIKIAGWIFVGDENKTTESIILKITGIPMIARIPMVDKVTKEFVTEQALKIASQL
ncbi:MAG: dethiobiotin synthase [Crocinitomicaceae bacterium]